MKQSLFVGIVILILCLSGCSKSAPEGDFSVNQTGTKEAATLTPAQSKTVSPTPMPTKTHALLSMPYPSLREDIDYFVYSVNDGDRKIILYDVDQEKKHEILREFSVGRFVLSSRDQIAFSTWDDEKEKIYLSTYPYTNEKTQLIFEADDSCTVLAWSPNGQFLAYYCWENHKQKLYVWNGYTSFFIYEPASGINEVDWSVDNRLAFGEELRHDGIPYGEISIWDGMEILNVNQNQYAEDRAPSWSGDGQLAFLSNWKDDYDVFIWDGYSMKNGVPDRDTYVNVSSDATDYYSYPIWKSNNELSFSGLLKEDFDQGYTTMQIYLWNFEKIINVSHNKQINCNGVRWSDDGYFSYVELFATKPVIYIMGNMGDLVLETDGQYSSAWGDDGNLLYCQQEGRGWILNMWNRDDIIQIDQGNIEAQWKNGQYVIVVGDEDMGLKIY